MRSGNGKHRRPRQAPALVVAAGVAGSAIAIPLLGATGASAAEATTWDRVADCESGGMWSADLGNGYYGGLQFSPEVWQKFGGTAYAQRADLASRSQQIQVAEKVLAEEGPQAWPSCALISGLTEGDDAAPGDGATAEPTAGSTVEPKADSSDAVPESSKAPESADATAEAPAGETGEGGSTTAAEPTTPPASGYGKSEEQAGESAEASAEASKAPAPPAVEEGAPKGKHRGEGARESDAAASGESGIERESARHASRGDGPTREAAEAEGADEAGEGSYTVRAGDNLWAIADAHDVQGGWTALYAANEKAVGSDPDHIVPGQSLDLG